MGERRWDDPIQRHAEEGSGHEEPWNVIAADRDRWPNLEAGFITRILRKRVPTNELARGRLFMTT